MIDRCTTLAGWMGRNLISGLSCGAMSAVGLRARRRDWIRAASVAMAMAGLSFASPVHAKTRLGVINMAAQAGVTLEIPVGLVSKDNITCLQLDLLFDPARVALGAAHTGAAAPDHRVSSANVASGRVRAVLYSPALAPLNGGYIVQVPVTWAAEGGSAVTVSDVQMIATNGTAVPLNSTDLKPEITVNPVAGTFPAGNPVKLTVTAEGLEPFSYQWLFNNQIMGGATLSELDFLNVSMLAGGNYSVIVTNAAGSATSAAAVLIVQGDNRIPTGFNVSDYLTRYPEVAAVYGGDSYGAWLYYRDHGIYQGEVFDDQFRVDEYLVLYPDLAAVFITSGGADLSGALMHWLTEGSIEGRLGRIPLEFSAQGYFARNADVAVAVNQNPILAWGHYWLYGIYEGRAYDDELRVFEYLAINADLTAAFVNDWRTAALHWMRYGRTEGRLGRIPLIFSSTEYLNRYPEVGASWGTYPTTVWLHFWLYGIDEARTFDNEFRVDEYLALNPDLALVLGTNRRAAFMHWVRYGRVEGRPGKYP